MVKGEVCTREKGVLSFAPPPSMAKETGLVRVIEVGVRGLRRKEAVFHVPLLFAFLPLTGNRGPEPDACCLWARRFRGRPAGLARPGTGSFQSRTWVKALTPLSTSPWRTPTSKTNWPGREPALNQIFPPGPATSSRAPQPAHGIELNASWRLLSLANCSNNGHYKNGDTQLKASPDRAGLPATNWPLAWGLQTAWARTGLVRGAGASLGTSGLHFLPRRTAIAVGSHYFY